MYCGSCLHDNTLAAALLELGEDVVLVPTYTPLRTDEADVSIERIRDLAEYDLPSLLRAARLSDDV